MLADNNDIRLLNKHIDKFKVDLIKWIFAF